MISRPATIMATLSDILYGVGNALDDLARYAVSSATSSTVTLSSWIDTTPNASPNQHAHQYVYVETGAVLGLQRRIKPGSWTSSGQVGVTPTWTTPAPGDSVLVTGLFPVIGGDVGPEDSSYRAHANAGLGRLRIRDTIGVPIATSHSLSLATWRRWLTGPEYLGSMREPSITGLGPPMDAGWRGIRAVFDAELPRLELNAPFATASGSLLVDVLRPANTWRGRGGVWSEIADGQALVVPSDEVNVSVEDAVTVTKVEMLHALAFRNAGQPSIPRAFDRYQEALAEARQLEFYDYRGARPAPAPARAPEAA